MRPHTVSHCSESSYDGEIKRVYDGGREQLLTGILIERCAPGFFGEECSLTCDKCRNQACSADRDGCACEAGYTGVLCNQKCPVNQWGVNCVNECDCRNGATCDSVTGECKCPPGISGKNCEDGCPAGHWGDQCDKRCRVSLSLQLN